MAPPTGPRNASAPTNTRVTRSATGAARGGGIRKRGAGGPTRVDRDGDLVMGQNLAANGDSKNSAGGPASLRGRPAPTRGSRQKAVVVAEHKLRRHLGGKESELGTRISELPRKRSLFNTKVFKITGLESSKAAGNRDRGEEGAVEFLERKTIKKGHGIKILKVCVTAGRGKSTTPQEVRRYNANQPACDKTIIASCSISLPASL